MCLVTYVYTCGYVYVDVYVHVRASACFITFIQAIWGLLSGVLTARLNKTENDLYLASI